MATVLEVYYRTAAYCAFLLWEKGLNAKAIHNEMFPVCGGKCLSRKAVHSWVEKRGKRFGDGEVAETTAKRLICCGFRRTGKAMRQVYQCWWRVCREINLFFFSGSNITCSTFYIYL
jgi:hypothetical protein